MLIGDKKALLIVLARSNLFDNIVEISQVPHAVVRGAYIHSEEALEQIVCHFI